MRMIILSADSTGYSADFLEEGYLPDELEWRLVQTADERFPDHKQVFHYDDENLPALDLLRDGRCEHKISFEYEVK